MYQKNSTKNNRKIENFSTHIRTNRVYMKTTPNETLKKNNNINNEEKKNQIQWRQRRKIIIHSRNLFEILFFYIVDFVFFFFIIVKVHLMIFWLNQIVGLHNRFNFKQQQKNAETTMKRSIYIYLYSSSSEHPYPSSSIIIMEQETQVIYTHVVVRRIRKLFFCVFTDFFSSLIPLLYMSLFFFTVCVCVFEDFRFFSIFFIYVYSNTQ